MLYQLSYSRISIVDHTPATSARMVAIGSVKSDGGESRIRTYEAVKQQIYSLPPLATWVSPLFRFTEPMDGFEPPTC